MTWRFDLDKLHRVHCLVFAVSFGIVHVSGVFPTEFGRASAPS
jgi:hypothetical protein